MAEPEDKDKETSSVGLGGTPSGPDFTYEENPDQSDSANENLMNYMHMADKPSGNRFTTWLARNKFAVAGGGGAIILLGGLFTFTAPLKLQGILSQLELTTTGRLEGYIEKRTERIIFQAIFHNIGVEDRNLVKGGSLIERVAKTMATNKFEQRLASKGISFTKDSEGVVRVQIKNPRDGLVIKTGLFKSVSEAQDFIDGIPVSRTVMKSIIKEDLGIWGYFARGKLAKWMLSYLGISYFGTKTVDKKATPEDKIKTQAIDDVTNGLEAQGRALEDGLNLMENAEKTGAAEERTASATQSAASNSAIKDAVSEAIDESKTSLSKSSQILVKIVSSFSESLGKKLADKLASKAIPVYGEVMMVASAVVFTHWVVKNLDNGRAARALAMPAASLMGYTYGVWQGYASQSKEGTLDPDLYNYFTPFLDGVETSSLFNCVDTNWQTGCDSTGDPAYKKLDETNNDFLKGIATAVKLDPTMAAVTSDWSPVYLLARVLFQLDNAITGFLMDQVLATVKKFTDFASMVASVVIPSDVRQQMQASVDSLMSSAGQWALNGILTLFGLNITPTMGGSKLFDVLLNGGTYTSNRYMETSLGMHKLDTATVMNQTQQYLAEQQEYDKSKGALYALFSPDATNSITSSLISRMSYDGGTMNTASNAVASIFGLVRSTPSSLASIVTNSASAASFTSPEAVVNAIPFGITDAEANADVSASVLDGQPCSTTSIGSSLADWFGISADNENVPYDSCAFDSSVAQSLLCSMDQSIRETNECNPDAGGAAALNSTTGTCPVVNGITTGSVSGITTGWDRSGNQQSITLCTVPGTSMSTIPHWASDARYAGTSAAGINEIAVNSKAASSLLQAAQLAEKDGVKLSASVGYRSLYEQCSIVMKPGNLGKLPSVCPSWVTAVPGNWSSTTIYSNHMMGYSIDFYQSSEDWMRKCEKNNLDGTADNRCFGFYDDVNQKCAATPGCTFFDKAHFTYSPVGGSSL